MQALKDIKKFFVGKKTYIVGILMIILGLLTDNGEMIMGGIGFITLRAGISNVKNE